MMKDRLGCPALLILILALSLGAFEAHADSVKARKELARLNLSFAPEDFIIAVKNDDLVAVKLFLDAGMKPDVKAAQVTALGVAAGLGKKDVAEVLVQGGADLEAKFDFDNMKEVTPLHAACLNGQLDVAKWLVGKGANPAAVDAQGTVPLQYVATLANFNEVGKPLAELLLSKGANINQTNKVGGTPLSYAAFSDNPEAITFLLAHGADAKHKNTLGMTAIDVARKFEKPSALAALLKNGVDVVTQDFKEVAIEKFGDEVKQTVQTNENVESVYKFIQDRLGVMEKQFSFSPEQMKRAKKAASDNVSVGALTVSKAMASPRSDEDNHRIANLTKLIRQVKTLQDDPKKRKSLIDAVTAKDVAKVVEAIKGGATPNTVDEDGNSMLAQAVGTDSLEVAKALVENGANVNDGMPNGSTPLHIAIAMKRYQFASFLLEKKANPDKPMVDGKTPLMTAAAAGDLEAVKMLMAGGADAHVHDGNGVTAHDYAGKNGDVAKLLE